MLLMNLADSICTTLVSLVKDIRFLIGRIPSLLYDCNLLLIQSDMPQTTKNIASFPFYKLFTNYTVHSWWPSWIIGFTLVTMHFVRHPQHKTMTITVLIIRCSLLFMYNNWVIICIA